MKAPRHPLALSWLSGFLLLGAVAPPRAAIAAPSPASPNLIFLFTDDQRYDALGLLHPFLSTPNLDELAALGVRFTNAFATSPICPSSRVTVLTGLHEAAHEYTFGQTLNLSLLERSVPRILRGAGYWTGFVGKNGIDLSAEVAATLFDEFVPVSARPYIQLREGVLSHSTDYVAERAAAMIAEHAAAGPIFLTVWFHAPHADDGDPQQFIPPTRYTDLHQGIAHPRPATSEPSFFDALPLFLRDSLNRFRWHWRWTDELYDPMMSRYLAMITGIDDAVGAIRSALDAAGVADRSVILFSSDNGFFVGERGFAGKWLAYEPSIRVPLLLYDPRTPDVSPGTVDRLVLNLDIPETLLDLAGEPIPPSMQGRSLLPLVESTSADWREEIFLEHSYPGPPTTPPIPRHRALRGERFKYIHYLDAGTEELYDLVSDPMEAVDLSAVAAHQATLESLRRRTEEVFSQVSALLFEDGFEQGDSSAWSDAVPP